jgi:hypothetical protein
MNTASCQAQDIAIPRANPPPPEATFLTFGHCDDMIVGP